jgi:hypothetical protein
MLLREIFPVSESQLPPDTLKNLSGQLRLALTGGESTLDIYNPGAFNLDGTSTASRSALEIPTIQIAPEYQCVLNIAQTMKEQGRLVDSDKVLSFRPWDVVEMRSNIMLLRQDAVSFGKQINDIQLHSFQVLRVC